MHAIDLLLSRPWMTIEPSGWLPPRPFMPSETLLIASRGSKPHAALNSARPLAILSISFGENCFHSALCCSCAKFRPITISESAGSSARVVGRHRQSRRRRLGLVTGRRSLAVVLIGLLRLILLLAGANAETECGDSDEPTNTGADHVRSLL